MIKCAECSAQFEPNPTRRQNLYCSVRCSRKTRYRRFKAKLKNNPRPSNSARAIEAMGQGCPVVAFHDRIAKAEVSSPFSCAMIGQAVKDARSESPQLAEEAKAWIRGDMDDRLDAPCRASVCFDMAGVNRGEALRVLGVKP